MFGQKKEKAVDASTKSKITKTKDVAPKNESKPAKPAKRKKDGMHTVIRESVVEHAIDDFKANTPFVTTYEGDTVYVGIMLDVNEIGGLSKKDKKDESKGSIIEGITSGRIKAYVTEDLMDDNKLVFIPDAVTLDGMDEFGILTTAPYELCYITDDGNIITSDITCHLQDVIDIISKDGNVSSLLGTDIEDDVLQDDDDDIPMDDESIPDLDESMDTPMDVDEPEIEAPYVAPTPAPIQQQAPATTYQEPVQQVAESVDDYSDNYQDDVPQDEYYDEQQDDVEYDNDGNPLPDEIDATMVEDAIVRKFYSDELNLEVSTEAFDAQFVHGNTYTEFNENRGDGWLNEQLNIMSHDANVEMRRVHRDNLFRMRERFFKLVSMHCEVIEHELDCNNAETQYGKMLQSILSEKLRSQDEMDSLIDKKRDVMTKAWEEKLRQVGEDAARAAQQQYRERFGRQHEDDLLRIEPLIRQDIDTAFEQSKRSMNEVRREEAAKRMDYGINETLQEISKMYLAMLDDEKVLYDRLATNMREFVEENRRDEQVRIQVLSEQLKQQQEADAVRAQYTEQMKTMTVEFDAKNASLQADIDRLHRENDRSIADLKKNYDDRLADANRRNQDLQLQIDNLLKSSEVRDTVKKAEMDVYVGELKAQLSSWQERCRNMDEANKRSHIISGALVGVIAIATICIGFIIGNFFGVKHNTEVITQDLLKQQTYQQQQNTTTQTQSSSTTTNGTTTNVNSGVQSK